MESPELKNRFNELRKYIPFLERVIQKLQHTKKEEHDSDGSSSNHLQKVKMLHDLLTNDSKKLTLDALYKCEKVLNKLYCKIEQDGISEKLVLDELDKDKSLNPTSAHPQKSEDTILSVPESPPPDDGSDDCVFVPLEIPTERRISPERNKSHSKHHKHSHRREKSHRDRSEYSEDRKFKQDSKLYYEKRDDFERHRYDRSRYDNDRNERDKYKRGSQNSGTDNHHDHRHHSHDRTHHDRENISERSKSNDDHLKDVFSRLGDKLTDDKLKNAAEAIKRTITQNVSASRSTSVNRSISKDFDDLKFENIEKTPSFASTDKYNTAYGIGERRDPKTESTGLSKLDEVRKKLSMLAKSSTDVAFKESPNAQKNQEQFYKSESNIVQDPRLKKTNYGSTNQTLNLSLPSMFPSLNRMDPRLRKNSNSSSCSSNSHSLLNETSKGLILDQGRNSNFLNRSSNGNLQKSLYSSQQNLYSPEDIWDADNLSSLNQTQSSNVPQSSWQSMRSDVFNQNPQPTPLSPTENWDKEINNKEKNYPNIFNCSRSYSTGSGRSPLNSQGKSFSNCSQSNLKTFPQHNRGEVDRPEPKKSSYISPPSKFGSNNNNHSYTNLFKSDFNSNGNLTNPIQTLSEKTKNIEDKDNLNKNNLYSNENGNNSEENWDDDDYTGKQLSSYELNRRRVLEAEKEEDKSKSSNNMNRSNHGEDDIPTSSKFNALLNDKSERIHYLESKKKKEENDLKCSRTYAEYKRRKAQLEENKRKMLAETKSEQKEHSVDEENVQKQHANYNDKNSNNINKSSDPVKKVDKNCSSTMKQDDQLKAKIESVKSGKDNNSNESKKSVPTDKIESVKSGKDNNSNESKKSVRTDKIESVKFGKDNNSNESKKSVPNDKVSSVKSSKTVKNKTSSTKVSVTNELKSEESKTIKKCEKQTTANSKNISSKSFKCEIKSSEKNKPNKKLMESHDDVKVEKITKEEVSKLRNFRESSMPRKRRNSMCEVESVSLVDKDKLKFANTILYADLQCEARPTYAKKTTNEKINNRNTESLANIFKKTDDNCTVSTQNIISGKRRTRTTVNFNEVQQAQTIFKHKKSSGSNVKKAETGENCENSDTLQHIDDTTCSSVKSSETSQESGNHEAINGFVQDMLKPDADMNYILSLLGKILPEQKLKLVETIIKDGQTNDNIDNCIVSNQTIEGNQNSNEMVGIKNTTAMMENDQEGPKKRIKKRNELDRLNDDIRDMFISEGVLTATGKRMCKLVNEKNCEETKEDKIAEKYSKILMRQCKIKLPKIKFPIKNITKTQIETSTNPLNDSKTCKMSFSTSKEEENINLKEDEKETDNMDNSELLLIKSEEKIKKKTKPQFSRKTIVEKDGIRNINKDHHFLSKYASEKCIICKTKNPHLSTHYQEHHAESYRSRLAPTVVKKIKAGVLGVAIFMKKGKNHTTVYHRCPICLQFGNRIVQDWMEHFRTHTSEYNYLCSYCRKGYNKKKPLMNHFQNMCPKGQEVVNKIPTTHKNCVKAYLCHLCNFVQLIPNHLSRHFVEQHGLDKNVVKMSDLEVNLMDFSKTEFVNDKRAAILQKKSLQQNFSTLFDDLETPKIEDSLENEKEPQAAEENEIIVKSEISEIPDASDVDHKVDAQDNELNVSVPKEDIAIAIEAVDPNASNCTMEVEDCEENRKEVRETATVLKHPKIDPQTSNIFLPTPRDTESPTTAFTEKLKTIEQESNQDAKTINSCDQNVSMAEKLSQRLKRFNKTEDKEIRLKSVDLTESVAPRDSKNGSDDDDSWVDIDSIDISRKTKDSEKNVEKSKLTNKKLHRFYASNANRARKIKGSYLNNKRPNINSLNKVKTSNKVSEKGLNQGLKTPANDIEKQILYEEPSETSTESEKSTNLDENTRKINYDKNLIEKRPNVNNIWNVGYSNDGDDVFKFYCLSNECTFLYSNEAIGLENHYLLDHMNLNWNGFCTSCDKLVEKDVDLYTVSHEIKHMIDVHLKKRNVATPEVNDVEEELPRPPEVNDVEDELPIPPEIDVEEELPRPPRIKIRRLSGDCLSMSPRPHIEQSITLPEIQSEPPPLVNIQSFENVVPVRKTVDIMNTHSSSSLGLQITNVCSLNQSTLTDCGLPKISNVCSLNPASAFNSAINENVCAPSPRDLNCSPEPIVVAETVPLARSKIGNFLITQTLSTHYGANGEQSSTPNMGFHIAVSNNTSSPISPPKPHLPTLNTDSITSESSIQNTPNIVPVENQVRTNQPPYRCMAKNCKYSTPVSVSMLNHLHFHEIRCFDKQRDFLRCNHCDHVSEDKVLLLQHIETEHLVKQKSANISGVSITSVKSKTKKRKQENKFQTLKDQNNEIKDAIIGFSAYTAHNADELYRCVARNCNTRLHDKTFCDHLKIHEMKEPRSIIEYRCRSCCALYKSPYDLLKHLKLFGIHHLFCYMCAHTTADTTEMVKHYREKHIHVDEVHLKLLLALVNTPKSGELHHSYFVAHGSKIQESEVELFKKQLLMSWQKTKLDFNKNVYHYTEVSRLPIQPIFQKEIHCADCTYKTKVRTNMLRHLGLHQAGLVVVTETDGQLDPINPMPCLNSTEKHFDKMTNLASSSLVPSANTGSTETPVNVNLDTNYLKIPYSYVPINRVYTCGIPDCKYLTLREDIFRSHVITLHGESPTYSCPFCKEEICKRGIVMDRIVNHIRFHDQYLYQCETCSYIHYAKSVVRRHIQEKHANLESVKLVAFDRGCDTGAVVTVTEVPTSGKEQPVKKNTGSTVGSLMVPISSNTQVQKKLGASCWKCDLCGIYSKTHNQMISHTANVHSCRHRFKCSLCGFAATKETQVLNHIAYSHESNIECTAMVMFHKEFDLELINGETNLTPKPVEQASLNTKPLWQRDDPQRVRSIRGILMEDEEETEQHRKRLRLDDYTENEEDEIVIDLQ